MSNSISAAKRRRAGNLTTTPIIPGNSNSAAQVEQNVPDVKKPMTIQQVISVLDKRLLYLETYTKTQMNKEPNNQLNVEKSKDYSASVNMDEITSIVQTVIGEHFSEFNHRYEMLAEEIINLKQIVMKLQSYTMDVNKTLLEERIQLLSEVSIDENDLKEMYVDGTVNLDDNIETIHDEPATESIEDEPTAESIEDEPTAESIEDEPTAESIEDEPAAKSIEDEPAAKSTDDDSAAKSTDDDPATESIDESATDSVAINLTNAENTTETKKTRKSRQKKVIQATWSDESNAESSV
jgi:hypothetical protein